MDCKQEEAVRAKGIAETKLQIRDFQLAYKMAVRAQQLDPNVDNISQLIIVCDVHCSAEKKFDGETDWYGILLVQQAADENKLPGADAAFKLIGEAQRNLLDLNSLVAHDRKGNGFSVEQPGRVVAY